MEKKQFLSILRDELIARGFTPELAERHVRSLSLTLDPDDIKAIERMNDSAEIAILAEGITSFKNKTAEQSEEQSNISADTEPDECSDDDVKVYSGGKAVPDPEAFAEEQPEEEASAEEEADAKEPVIVPTQRGQRIFRTVFCCTLPITAALLLIYYALFGAAFAGLCALIVGLFAALIGGVAIGTTLSLVGIIYGIIQLITAISPAPGLYELGLGLTVAGCVMLSGILIYNCAIRLVPWLIRKLAVFFRFCSIKLKHLFKKAKEACYKL